MDRYNHPLQPVETIHKVLISTTSRMVGEYESDDILITHAWHSMASDSIRREENPVSRSGFVVAFQTEPHERMLGSPVPDYSHVGEIICSYLSVLFGKRFDCHGLIEGSGSYFMPDLSAYNSICNPKLPFNNHQERGCFNIPLNINNFECFERLWFSSDSDLVLRTKLNLACKFYMQALQNVEHEPEIAYLHLITVGEILASTFKYKKEEILDRQMLDYLNVIKLNIDNGEKVAKEISKRLFCIKRSFVKSLCSLVDAQFFEPRESKMKYGHFKAEEIERSIGAAYDLRSKYVHTGVPFGSWIKPRENESDLQSGRPIVGDRDFSRILEKAPTFLGLERFVRYCLLSFMASNGFPGLVKYRENI